MRGRCLPYGDGITFWPITEIVRNAAEIDDEDNPETAHPLSHRRRTLDEAASGAEILARIASVIGLTSDRFAVAEIFWPARTEDLDEPSNCCRRSPRRQEPLNAYHDRVGSRVRGGDSWARIRSRSIGLLTSDRFAVAEIFWAARTVRRDPRYAPAAGHLWIEDASSTPRRTFLELARGTSLDTVGVAVGPCSSLRPVRLGLTDKRPSLGGPDLT